MTFYSRSKKPPREFTPPGTHEEPEFQEIINDNGVKELKQVGMTNVYDRIQASHEDTKIYNILNRYENGDITVLNKAVGQFGDFTEMPTSLADAQNRVIKIEKEFKKLPIKFREKFNNNPQEFLNELGKGNIDNKIREFVEDIQPYEKLKRNEQAFDSNSVSTSNQEINKNSTTDGQIGKSNQ